jgi:hypothetical protein
MARAAGLDTSVPAGRGRRRVQIARKSVVEHRVIEVWIKPQAIAMGTVTQSPARSPPGK